MVLAAHNFIGIRLGRVSNIDYSTNLCEVKFYDKFGGSRQNVHLVHPYVGRGWGILAGVEIGSLVLVGEETNGDVRLLAYLPQTQFFRSDVNKFDDVSPDESPYQPIRSGEIVLQSKPNSVFGMNDVGDIVLSTPDGNTIEIDREADLIFQQSALHEVVSDAGTFTSGVVQRDIRSLKERDLDVVFGGTTELGLDFNTFTETIGVNPSYPDIGAQGGKSANFSVNENLIPGLADPFFPETISQGGGSGVNISDMLNPALTEWRAELREFGDGNPGLDPPIINDQAKRQGHLDPNTIADITCGTLVNEAGRQVRFDYYFGIPRNETSGKGHNRAWTTVTNQLAYSVDHMFDRDNTLKGAASSKPSGIAAPGHNDKKEWTVDTNRQSPTAILFRALFHTKGVDNFGRAETELSTAFRSGDKSKINQALQNSFPGSLWEFAVDKEGLTKINIPAATSLPDKKGNPLEPFREGRSLLMNMDGDATITIGKQKATKNFGLPRLTTDMFLNRNDYPDYGRRDRSLTLDLEGNLETFIGAENNTNQSIIMQADGSIALSVGREGDNGLADRGATPAGLPNMWDFPITPAAKAPTRKDRSLTGKFLGNIELQVGSDGAAKQSIIISTTGGNGFRFGQDIDQQSLQLATSGGIDIQIQGPMKGGYALHIDAEGAVHIRASGDIQVETAGKCHVHSDKDMSFESLEGIQMHAKKDIDLRADGKINLNAATIAVAQNFTDNAITVNEEGVEILAQGVTVNALEGVGIVGSVGITGKFAVQGDPINSPMLSVSGDSVKIVVDDVAVKVLNKMDVLGNTNITGLFMVRIKLIHHRNQSPVLEIRFRLELILVKS